MTLRSARLNDVEQVLDIWRYGIAVGYERDRRVGRFTRTL
jgi:hypothetical protein